MEERHSPESANPISVPRILVAGILLNMGLFPVLYIVSPIVTGVVVGLLVKKPVDAFAAGFVTAFAASLIVFGALVAASVFYIETPSLILGSLLMGAPGGAGGFIGGLIVKRIPQDRPD